jgi:hypothetical protein
VVEDAWTAAANDRVHIWNTLCGGIVAAGNNAEAFTITEVAAAQRAVVSYAQQLYNQAVGHTNAAVAGEAAQRAQSDTLLLHYDQQLYNQAVAHADAITRAEAAARAAGDTVLLHYDQQLYNQAITHADQLHVIAEDDIRAGENQAAVALKATSTADRTFTTTVGNAAIATSLKGAASLVAQLQAKLSPAISALQTETDQCLKPLCDTVTPNAKQLGKLGSELTSLEVVGWLAILAALVAEAVHDPAAAAHGIDEAGGWVAGTVGDLVGVVG